MAYIPNKADSEGRSNWQPGDRLTPENLNHIENELVDLSKGAGSIPVPTPEDFEKAIIVDEYGNYTLGEVTQKDVYTKEEIDEKLIKKVNLLLEPPTEDLDPEHPEDFAIVFLDEEPAEKYKGYLYIINKDEEPGHVEGREVILGTNDRVDAPALVVGTSSVDPVNNAIRL